MNSKLKLICLLCSSAGMMLASLPGQAEVKSLSSSELTETYIKDSTIIVTPKKKSSQTEQTTYSTLTISPVGNDELVIDQLKGTQDHLTGNETAFALSDELLRNASVESAIFPPEVVAIQSYQDSITLPVAELLDDARYLVPEGDFDLSYIGDNLGLSRTGDQLTFSIGNIPGIDQINLPQGINESPLQIVPRVGGGFDLTINIPRDN